MQTALEEELYSETRENRPRLLDRSGVLEKYWKRIEPKIKNYLNEKLGYIPSFDDSEVEIRKLPTLKLHTGAGYERRVVAKIFGAYDPLYRKVYLDPAIFEELKDPEREELERYGVTVNPIDILVHELVHHVQRNLGALHNQPCWYIEGVATKITEEITGRSQKSYRMEKEKIEDVSRYFSPEELLRGAKKINLN